MQYSERSKGLDGVDELFPLNQVDNIVSDETPQLLNRNAMFPHKEILEGKARAIQGSQHKEEIQVQPPRTEIPKTSVNYIDNRIM